MGCIQIWSLVDEMDHFYVDKCKIIKCLCFVHNLGNVVVISMMKKLSFI